MDLHGAMNDAGNFLIETCDETVSHDLKQQLLLLNGRWRELFLKVSQVADERCPSAPLGVRRRPQSRHLLVSLPVLNSFGAVTPPVQYAHADETERWRRDHLKAVSGLKELLDTAEVKLNAAVQVSFLSVRAFLQDVEVRTISKVGQV